MIGGNMSLNIDKKQMDEAWRNRYNNDEFMKYIYLIAKAQVSKKSNISYDERPDYIQFAVYKCFSHQDSFDENKGTSYSFFWKQVSLAIAYKQRKQARRKNKINTFYVEQEKVLDWAEQQWHKDEDGDYFRDIVDEEEPKMLKKAFRKYKKENNIKKLEYNKENAKKVVAWMENKEPGFTEKFTTLKGILNSWVADNKIKT